MLTHHIIISLQHVTNIFLQHITNIFLQHLTNHFLQYVTNIFSINNDISYSIFKFLHPFLPMELTITGYKKTNPNFLKSIFKDSVLLNTLKNSPLDILSKFSSLKITNSNNKINLQMTEFKKKLNIGFSKTGFYANIFYPNIFGNGEILNLTANDKLSISFEKPFIGKFFRIDTFKENMLNFNIMGIKSGIVKKNLSCELGYEHIQCKEKESCYKSDISSSYKNDAYHLNENLKPAHHNKYFVNLIGRICNLNMHFQSGIVKNEKKSFFSKLDMNYKFNYKLGNLFYNLNLFSGFIIGKAHRKDKIYIGSNLPGYKNNSISFEKGGRSYCEIINKLGLSYKYCDVFIYHANGMVSNQYNLYNTLRSNLYSMVLLPEVRNIGISTGVGVKIPVMGKKVCFMYNIPLGYKENFQSFNFGMEF